jgi:hypothetical protein
VKVTNWKKNVKLTVVLALITSFHAVVSTPMGGAEIISENGL